MKKCIVIIGLMLCALTVSAQEIWMNPNFICVYGKDITVNGRPMLVGDTIKAYSPRGIYCGVGVLQPYITYFNTILRFMPIYGEDPWQNGDNGVHLGDTVYFKLKYQEIVTNGRIWFESNAIPLDSATQSKYTPIVVKEFYTIDHPLFAFKTTCCLYKGDVNMDGNIDIEDLTQLIAYINARDTLRCSEAADLDNDGAVDIVDLTRLIDFMFISLEPLGECK